jgi:hypothetical protein
LLIGHRKSRSVVILFIDIPLCIDIFACLPLEM